MIKTSSIIQLVRSFYTFDKGLKVIKNGADNHYPEEIESLFEGSVTALRCAEVIADFITGKGFGDDLNKVVVHKAKGTTLFQLLDDISSSYSKHKGVAIHVNYDANHDIKDLDVLPFMDCRIGKKDDDDYNGKILLCKDWQNTKLARKAKAIDVYNPDKKIIAYQIENAGGIKHYKGQILFFKKGSFIYPVSPLHPVRLDAESEKEVALFKNGSLKKGFFGKMLAVTKPMIDDTLREVDYDSYKEQETEREKFRKTLQDFIGAENTGGVLHVEMEFESDKIEDEFLLKQIDSNINDKLFAHTEDSVANNICAALKVPQVLVRQKDNNMFSASGEVLLQAKLFVQEQTEKDRINIENLISDLMSRFQNPLSDLNIIPLIRAENETDNQD